MVQAHLDGFAARAGQHGVRAQHSQTAHAGLNYISNNSSKREKDILENIEAGGEELLAGGAPVGLGTCFLQIKVAVVPTSRKKCMPLWLSHRVELRLLWRLTVRVCVRRVLPFSR